MSKLLLQGSGIFVLLLLLFVACHQGTMQALTIMMAKMANIEKMPAET